MQTENPLGSRPLPQLLASFAIPSILAMLVSSLYNIVDQIFIGQGVGYLGNAILLGIIVGISQGTQPILSFNYGAAKYDRVRGIYLLAVRLSLIISAVGFVAFQLFPKEIVSLFGTGDHLYFEFAVKFMRTYLLMVVVNGVQLLSSNYFAAIGKPIRGLLLALTRQVFFLVPLLVVLPLFWRLDGLLFATPIADFIAFVTSVLTMRAELRRLPRTQAPQPA